MLFPQGLGGKDSFVSTCTLRALIETKKYTKKEFSLAEYLSLGGLFVASCLAATLLPGGSEFVLAALLNHHPELYWPALAVATLGNTLGGMTSYAVGWLLPRASDAPRIQARVQMVRRFGTPTMLLSWVPVVGDALCVAAGWLRLPVVSTTLFMALGKFVRYWIWATAIM